MAKFKDFYSSFKDSRSSSNTGWGLFFTFLGTVFCVGSIISKLTGTNDSSWWWILAPLWIPLVFIIVMLLGIGGVIIYKELRK
jgi:uncharacterized membrane protein YhdT